MSALRRLRLAILAALLPFLLHAQQFSPHAGYVYPAGGQQGTTFTVTIGGQFLDNVNSATISGPGIQTRIIQHVKPMTQAQFNKLREELQELMEKRNAANRGQRRNADAEAKKAAPWTPDDEKAVAELRMKLAEFIRRPANPAIAETVTVEVSVEPGAAAGRRELRLSTPLGLTNPLVFVVGELPEFSKPPSKVLPENLPAKAARFRDPKQTTGPNAPAQVTLPAVLNGQMMPGTVEHYRFQGRKGQRIVATAGVRALIPYISDAVPGWFQATLALYDSRGKEVQYAGGFRFQQDPVLLYEVAEDGDYTLEIKDSIYRGREDFVYRISIGELPFITSIFPLGGKAGSQTAVEVKGWNLPVSRVTENTKDRAPGVYPVSVRKDDLTSNRVPFAVDNLPERVEQEPNNLPKNATALKLPVIVNGRVDKPGDQDVFRFEARAGDEIVADVMARRLDSPLDSILKLTDSKGRQIAINDDTEDKSAGLLTHHADARVIAKLPAKGTYYLWLGDTQGKGGTEYAYRLRVATPQPDFELRVVPSSLNARGGLVTPVAVYAVRKDGFDGDIALKLKFPPPGFALSGGLIPAGQDQVRVTLTVPVLPAAVPFKLDLEGRASVRGREVTHPALPAEDMMQAFFYHHLVPSREWVVRVTPGARRAPWKLAFDKPVRLPADGSAPVKVAVPLGAAAELIRLALNEPPAGITIESVQPAGDGITFTLHADAKVKPGLKGNLIVDVAMEGNRNAKAKQPQRRQPAGVLPAIPFEVVPAAISARR